MASVDTAGIKAEPVPTQSPDVDDQQKIRDESQSHSAKVQEENNEVKTHAHLTSAAIEIAQDRTELILELPRDILTAFFLLRLPRDDSRYGIATGESKAPKWYDYSRWGKFCLWCSVLLPYFVQFYVMSVLLADLPDTLRGLESTDLFENFAANTTAFSVLFIYMFKDLSLLYSSVWFYIKWLSRQYGGIRSNLKDAAGKVVNATKEQLHEKTESYLQDVTEATLQSKRVLTLLLFQSLTLMVVVLYLGLAIYALLIIPAEDSVIGKLEISLGIFIVLEVDDWAYQLFIAQANILDDNEFDVVVFVPTDRGKFVQRQEKFLTTTLGMVVASIFLAWVGAFGLQEWITHN